jgi:Tfp pilus assembly protein PilF
MSRSMDPQEPSPGRRAGFPAAVFLVAFLAFTPALGGEFLNWDDNLVLTDHQDWRGLGADQVRTAFTNFRAGHYHPLTWLSFGLDYELWGMNPRGYHLANLVLHAATALFVYGILLFLLERAGPGDLARLGAAIGAAFFAVHPLRVESVAWITERRDVLSGALLALTVLAWLKWTAGGGRKWYAISVAAFALSLLSKAWGITLPVVLLILDAYPLRRWEPGKRGAVLAEKIPYVALAIAAGVVAYLAQNRSGAMNLVEGHTLVDRLVQSGYGLFFYPAKTLAPVGLNPLYALKPSFNPFEAKFLAGAALGVAITAAAIVLRRRWPWMLAAWAVYVISVSPVLGMTQSGPQLVADRYSYLACIPFAALVAAGVVRLRTPAPRIAAAAVVAVFGVVAWTYSHEWRDSVSLWSRAARLDPGNSQAWYNLGSAKLTTGDAAGALDALNRALEVDPKYAAAWVSRGIARQDSDAAGAVADFDEAIRLRPDDADAYVNRGWVRFFGPRDLEGGMADFETAIRLDPDNPKAYLRRGIARMTLRDPRAKDDLATAIRITPSDPDPWYVRGQVRQQEGDFDGAITDYAQALNLGWPDKDKAKRQRAEELLAEARRLKARK